MTSVVAKFKQSVLILVAKNTIAKTQFRNCKQNKTKQDKTKQNKIQHNTVTTHHNTKKHNTAQYTATKHQQKTQQQQYIEKYHNQYKKKFERKMGVHSLYALWWFCILCEQPFFLLLPGLFCFFLARLGYCFFVCFCLVGVCDCD